MKKNLFVTFLALIAVSVFTAFLITVCEFADTSAIDKAAEEKVGNIPVEGEKKPQFGNSDDKINYQYYLKEYNGKLAVYLPGEELPQTVFEVYLSTLPEYDRGQLILGVPVSDYGELVQRIEDYIS